ncbi:MAG: histidinol-phosphate transaminase [Oleibacter sp.]|nr:histidinol-phosphate transaminase [Thalassolituus sp.]
MAVNFTELAVEGVRLLRPYQPGKPIDELAREFGLNEADIVKLASNENPMGPGPKALAAIQSELADLTRYPDGAGFALKSELCKQLNLRPEQITLGNGSSDILDFIVRSFVNDGDDVIVSQHAFAIYGLVAKMVGANCIAVPAKNYGHDLVAMAAAITDKTRIVFVTNPNNPTGTWNTSDELVTFLNAVPKNVLVLLDEAYFEYVHEADYPNGIELLDEYSNLVVTRTFSKAYGLAALRVGYGVSSPELADIMNRVRPPFNVDSFALAAATATLQDHEYVKESIAINDAGMAYFIEQFQQLGLSYVPSVGNFICFEVPTGVNSMDVYQGLLQRGVIIRPVANYEMPNHLRVSIGTSKENQVFIAALTEILSGVASSEDSVQAGKA